MNCENGYGWQRRQGALASVRISPALRRSVFQKEPIPGAKSPSHHQRRGSHDLGNEAWVHESVNPRQRTLPDSHSHRSACSRERATAYVSLRRW
jgi:hypothetical protein